MDPCNFYLLWLRRGTRELGICPSSETRDASTGEILCWYKVNLGGAVPIFPSPVGGEGVWLTVWEKPPRVSFWIHRGKKLLHTNVHKTFPWAAIMLITHPQQTTFFVLFCLNPSSIQGTKKVKEVIKLVYFGLLLKTEISPPPPPPKQVERWQCQSIPISKNRSIHFDCTHQSDSGSADSQDDDCTRMFKALYSNA